VGHSDNPHRRLVEHNSGKTDRFSGKFSDWELQAIFKAGANRTDAMAAERFIKKQKSRKFIQLIIDKHTPLNGKLAQLVRVPHVRD
jgi:putative endonuclease